MNGPIEYAKGAAVEATKQAGRFEGKAEAFTDMAERLDPAKYCQDCGYGRYKQTDRSYGQTKEEHEAGCEVRTARVFAEKKRWAEYFKIKGEIQPGQDADSFQKPK